MEDDSQARPGLFNIRARLESCFSRMERILVTLEQNPDPRIQLAGAAEMRKLVALTAQTLEIAVRADALRDFEKSVLDALDEAGIRPRRKIMGLFEERADQSDNCNTKQNNEKDQSPMEPL